MMSLEQKYIWVQNRNRVKHHKLVNDVYQIITLNGIKKFVLHSNL